LESNWRWNVAELGMQGTDWELAAEIPEPVFGQFYLVKRKGSLRGWVYYVLDPDQLPTLWLSFVLTPAMGHFPWGEIVNPD